MKRISAVGLCTDVGVVSNALIIRTGYPNSRIREFNQWKNTGKKSLR